MLGPCPDRTTAWCAPSGPTSTSTRRARPSASLGAKLIDLPAPDAKLVPEQLAELAHLQRRAAPRPAGRGVDHPERPSSARSTPPTRSPRSATPRTGMGMLVHMDGARIANATAALGGDARGAAVVHGRRRRRRAHLRRHEERPARRRGRRLPQPRARRRRGRSCASRSRSCRRRCASSPPSSTPCSTTTSGSTSPSHANAMARAPVRAVTAASTASTSTVHRPSTACSRRCPRHAIEPLQRLVLLLGLGRGPRPGALDDGVGHDRRRRRALRRGRSGGARRARLIVDEVCKKYLHRAIDCAVGSIYARSRSRHAPGHGGTPNRR